MPNWVYNTMTVKGKKEEVQRFVNQAKQPGLISSEGEALSDLSFANFVRPDESIMGEYWGDEPKGRTIADAIKNEGNWWYDWNCRNWGVKWDASDVQVIDRDDNLVQYSFATPWDKPFPVFIEMSKQFPDLDFTLTYEEEQGWGGEIDAMGGTFWVQKEWDIPEERYVAI